MKVIIAADSVFQLICALNIAYVEYPNDSYIILLRDVLWNTNKRLELKNIDIINTIYYTNINCKDIYKWRLWKITALISSKYAISKMFTIDLVKQNVAAIISSTTVNYLTPLYKTFKKNAPDIYFVEEGIGEYTKSHISNENTSFFSKVKSKLFGQIKINEIAIKRYILPEFKYNFDLKTKRAPMLSTDFKFKSAILDLFGGREVAKIINDANIIYFEQPFMAESKSNNILHFIELETNIINALLVEKNSIIKMHPRSSTMISEKYKCVQSTTPWEAILPSINCEDKTLISISSTSIVTPKLMLNQEPIVICLLLIFKDLLLDLLPSLKNEDIERQIEFFETVKNKYKDSSKFIIPKDMVDLKQLLLNYNFVD